MEIPRHWRLKDQRIAFKNLFQNPVARLGIQGAVKDSVDRQNRELKPIQAQIAKEEAIEEEEEKKDKQRKAIMVYDSGFLFSPNNQVVHREVVRQD